MKSECNVANVTIAEDVPTPTSTTPPPADGEPAKEDGDKMQVERTEETQEGIIPLFLHH